MRILLKRVYETRDENDGYRVLVDRIWPRGVSRQDAHIDEWLRDIAPSNELRSWFGHDPERWEEFKKRYFEELEAQSEMVAGLRTKASRSLVTLVFAAKDQEHNNAVALLEYLKKGGE